MNEDQIELVMKVAGECGFEIRRYGPKRKLWIADSEGGDITTQVMKFFSTVGGRLE